MQNRGPLRCASSESGGTRSGPMLEVVGTVSRIAETGSAAPPSHGGGHGDGRIPQRESADTGILERESWVVLLGVPGLGPVTFAALLARFGSARAVLAAAAEPNGAARLAEAMANTAEPSPGDTADEMTGSKAGFPGPAGRPLGDRPGAGAPRSLEAGLARRIQEYSANPDSVLAPVKALGLKVVTLDDPEYPGRLRLVDMPPPLLFVRGVAAALAAPSAVAVVGTRWPSDKGRMIAAWIGSSLARAGSVVVSGLAVGIDGAAHAAVVAEGLATVAVLGGGHARLFPRAHERLADAIVEAGGAVVAELAPDIPATRGTFPRRNRLVSGLSDATIVVEAGKRSGALITAGWALEQGRDCFLVPGPMDAPTSEGCHAFLRSYPGQTRVVCGIPELLEDLGLAGGEVVSAGGAAHGRPGAAAPGAGPEAVLASLGAVERSLAEALAPGPATADDLARKTGLSGAAVLSALTLLELRGLVVGAYGRYMPAGVLARWSGRRGDRGAK